MANPISLLVRSRRILWATTLNDVRARYAGSVLGLVWMVLYPFLFLGIYAAVFTFILRVRLEHFTSVEYILMIFAGLIPFIGVSEALSASAPAVVGNKALLKNTMFPAALLPVKAVLSSSITMVVGLIGLLFCLWVTGRISVVRLLVLPILLLQLMFSVGLGWLISALTVFF